LKNKEAVLVIVKNGANVVKKVSEFLDHFEEMMVL
jgi:hypothetical protein